MRFSLRTLLVVMLLGGPVLAVLAPPALAGILRWPGDSLALAIILALVILSYWLSKGVSFRVERTPAGRTFERVVLILVALYIFVTVCSFLLPSVQQ